MSHLLEEDVLCPVTDTDIPEQLMTRLTEEKKLEAFRRKERQEAHFYMSVNIITEDLFCGHQGEDLFEFERCHLTRHVKILKTATYNELMVAISKAYGYPTNQFRLWLFSQRPNNTWRPTLLEIPESASGKPLIELAENENPWHVWLEFALPDAKSRQLPVFDKQGDILLFLKMFNPQTQTISYCGHLTIPIDGPTVAEMEGLLRKRGGLPDGTPLQIYEEISSAEVRQMKEKGRQMGEVMDKLMDGNIIVFQPECEGKPDAAQYFLDIYYRVDVLMCDKNDPADSGFLVSLNRNWNYNQMAEKVAERLDTDPTMLQFFKVQSVRDMVGAVIRSNFDGQVKDLLQLYGARKQTNRRLYYQQLTMKVEEFETKKAFPCQYVELPNKEQDMVLYPNKNCKVQELFVECRKKIKDIPEDKQMRLMEVVGNKIQSIVSPEKTIEELLSYTNATKTFRLEIIPDSQLKLNDDEALIGCVHFHKEIYNTHGIPTLVKVKTGESFANIRDRIQNYLEISQETFNKYKVAVIFNGQVKYVPDDIEDSIQINLKEFMSPSLFSNSDTKLCTKAWIGLDHMNKMTKKNPRFNLYTEKPIKIHN